MKKIVLLIVLAAGSCFMYGQQRFAYVDSDYILNSIPDYESALTEIDNLSVKWQKEIEERFAEIDALYRKFQSDAPLLSDDMRKKRETEIVNKEKEAKDLQKKRFGTEGDLFKKRQEMIRPIQDRVYTAIEKRAADKGYTFVFDRADNANILYADNKIDISNDVLSDMGVAAKNRVGANPSSKALDKK
ncbi:membrane protein [Bacteroidia bacterium]|nr:membrane protein [Bacteroidia bacterium]